MIAMMMVMNMIDWTKEIAYDVDVTQKYNEVHSSTGWMKTKNEREKSKNKT